MTPLVASLLILSALTTAAAADPVAAPADHYVGVGGLGAADPYLRIGVLMEGGIRLGETSVFARGYASAGDASDLAGKTGTYRQLRGGLESRHCLAAWPSLCGTAGIDFGVSTETIAERMTTTTQGALVVPRVGVEIGALVRFVTAIELPMYADLATRDGFEIGAALSFGVAYAF